MKEVRLVSVAPGLAGPPSRVDAALRLIARGQVMGFLPDRSAGAERLDEPLLRDVLAELAARGLVRDAPLRLRAGADLDALLAAALEAVDASPQPAGEWAPAREVLGDDLLGELVGVSESSLRRYAAAERATPDAVAWRLHAVARMLSGLLGAYNDHGARRWFRRPRVALGGRTPAAVVAGAPDEHDPDLVAALGLADALMTPGGAG